MIGTCAGIYSKGRCTLTVKQGNKRGLRMTDGKESCQYYRARECSEGLRLVGGEQ